MLSSYKKKNNKASAKPPSPLVAQVRRGAAAVAMYEGRLAAARLLRANPPPPRNQGPRPRGSVTGMKNRAQASAASAYATGQVGQAPVIRATRDMCRITHREFISNVTGTAAFTIGSTFAVNPGLSASFPWLATQAQGWESYRFRSLRFCYYTRTGSNIPGSVLLIPDYDASDAAPVSETVASSYEDIAEDAPWKDICCQLRPTALNSIGPKHFVRTGALAANQDIKTYDVAQLFVATVDGTAVSWGKLWVEYDIEFYQPQLPPVGSFLPSNVLVGNTALTAANPYGTNAISSNGSVGVSAVNSSGLVTFTGLEIGSTYVVSSSITGTVITAYDTATPTGWTLKTTHFPGSFNAAATNAGAIKTYTATATTASLTTAVTATTVTLSTLFVSKYVSVGNA